jgi:hypothetical protein
MGENSSRKILGRPVSTHAEMEVLRKLYKMKPSVRDSRNLKKCDILVIRVSSTGKLGQSRPCYHCLQSLSVCDIKIRYIYYSTSFGTITREKFDGMLSSELTLMSSGWRKFAKNPTPKAEPVKTKEITLIGPDGERIIVNESEYNRLKSLQK